MTSPARRAVPLLMLLAGCVAPGDATQSIGAVATASASPSAAVTATPTPLTSPAAVLPPVPDGFPVMASMEPADTGGEPEVIAAWRTPANGSRVYAFYEEHLANAGYEIDLAGPGDTVAVFRFTPPGADQLQLDMYADEDGTSLQLRLPRS